MKHAMIKPRTLASLCLALLTIPLLTASAAYDIFAYFPGSEVEGETQDIALSREGAFELLSFEIGAENSINIGNVSSGGGAGRATFKEMTLTKKVDSATTGIFANLAAGDHFNDMVIVVRSSSDGSGSTGLTFLKYEFKLVMVSDISWSASDGDDIVEETVTFQYGAKKITYTKQDMNGQAGDMFDSAWSQILNQANFAIE